MPLQDLVTKNVSNRTCSVSFLLTNHPQIGPPDARSSRLLTIPTTVGFCPRRVSSDTTPALSALVIASSRAEVFIVAGVGRCVLLIARSRLARVHAGTHTAKESAVLSNQTIYLAVSMQGDLLLLGGPETRPDQDSLLFCPCTTSIKTYPSQTGDASSHPGSHQLGMRPSTLALAILVVLVSVGYGAKLEILTTAGFAVGGWIVATTGTTLVVKVLSSTCMFRWAHETDGVTAVKPRVWFVCTVVSTFVLGVMCCPIFVCLKLCQWQGVEKRSERVGGRKL